MKLNLSTTVFNAIVIMSLILQKVTKAHLPYIELERARKLPPAVAGEDLTFDDPFDILEETKVPGIGMVRPQMSIYLESVLHDKDDADYFLYDKTSNSSTEWNVYAYPIVPVCAIYTKLLPSVAMLGPLDTVDSQSGESLFKPMSDAKFDIPEGYGAKILTQKTGPGITRETYFAPEAQTSWWLPYGWPAECIDGWKDPIIGPTCDTSNVLFYNIREPGQYYFVIFDEATELVAEKRDVALVVGTIDQFFPPDWARVSGIQSIVSAGRSISNICVDPKNVVDDKEEPKKMDDKENMNKRSKHNKDLNLFEMIGAICGILSLIGVFTLIIMIRNQNTARSHNSENARTTHLEQFKSGDSPNRLV